MVEGSEFSLLACISLTPFADLEWILLSAFCCIESGVCRMLGMVTWCHSEPCCQQYIFLVATCVLAWFVALWVFRCEYSGVAVCVLTLRPFCCLVLHRSPYQSIAVWRWRGLRCFFGVSAHHPLVVLLGFPLKAKMFLLCSGICSLLSFYCFRSGFACFLIFRDVRQGTQALMKSTTYKYETNHMWMGDGNN